MPAHLQPIWATERKRVTLKTKVQSKIDNKDTPIKDLISLTSQNFCRSHPGVQEKKKKIIIINSKSLSKSQKSKYKSEGFFFLIPPTKHELQTFFSIALASQQWRAPCRKAKMVQQCFEDLTNEPPNFPFAMHLWYALYKDCIMYQPSVSCSVLKTREERGGARRRQERWKMGAPQERGAQT